MSACGIVCPNCGSYCLEEIDRMDVVYWWRCVSCRHKFTVDEIREGKKMSNKKEEWERIAAEQKGNANSARTKRLSEIEAWLCSLNDTDYGYSSLVGEFKKNCEWLVAELKQAHWVAEADIRIIDVLEERIRELEEKTRRDSVKCEKGKATEDACEHNFEHIETIYTDSFDGRLVLYIRIDRFYCTKCLEERTKRHEDFCERKPDWYLAGGKKHD